MRSGAHPPRPFRWRPALLAVLVLAGCSAWYLYPRVAYGWSAPLVLPGPAVPPTAATGAPALHPDEYSARGLQVGDRLTAAMLVDQYQHPRPLAPDSRRPYTVVVTGAITCPITRYTLPALEQVARRHPAELAVRVVYVLEPHPVTDVSPYRGDEWVTEANQREQLLERQPTSQAERCGLALALQRRLRLGLDLVVDDLHNTTWAALGGGPNLAVVVDQQGIVRYKQGWLQPAQLEAWLATHPAPAAPAGAGD